VKRQSFAAVSALWTGFAAGHSKSATVSIQLGVARYLQGQSEFFVFFNPSVVKTAI